MILDFINYVNCKSGITVTEIFHGTLRALMRQLTSSCRSILHSCVKAKLYWYHRQLPLSVNYL